MQSFPHTVAISLLLLLSLASGAMASKDAYFEVARDDVAVAVAEALTEREAADKVQAIVYSASPTLFSANKPLSVAIHALSFDQRSHKWSANMHVLSDGKTVHTAPIKGRYEAVINIPVLTRKTANNDIITDADIAYIDVPERLVRKDTVLAASDILGKTPKRIISPNRPIRLTEVNLPAIIKKGSTVEIQYSAPFMNIRTLGQALEDGSLGSMVRVKNHDSERAISARVVSAGVVETNPKQPLAIN